MLIPTAFRDWDESAHPRDPDGKFTGGGGDSGGAGTDGGGSKLADVKEKIRSFIRGPGLSVIHAVGEKLKENQKELLATAVTAGLYHVVGLDFPADVEAAIHHEVSNLGTNAQMSVALARDHMRRAVDALVALRRQKAMKDDEEDEILAALLKLKTVLDKDELFKEAPGMPVPKPHKDESQDDFTNRCMHALGQSDPDRPNEQRLAMCFSAWREEHGGDPPKKAKRAKQDIDDDDIPEPDRGEEEDDFIDRCTDELTDNFDLDDDAAADICQARWDELGDNGDDNDDYDDEYRSGPQSRTIHKTHAGEVNGMEFVLSDESPDRIGDVILSDGWQLSNFRKNPIALFGHRPDFIVGRWANLRVENKSLRGHLALAPEGTSARIDEIRKLVEAGILKAVSVGFHSIEDEPLDKKNAFGGRRFLKQELVECSLVAIPANQNALAVAKSLKISPQTIDLVFAAGQGARNARRRRRGTNGGHAETSPTRKASVMTLAHMIPPAQARVVDLRDKLAEFWQNVDQTNISDANLESANGFNAELARAEKHLAALMESEKHVGTQLNGEAAADADRMHKQLITTTGFVPPQPKLSAPNVIKKLRKELEPIDYLVRSIAVLWSAKSTGSSVDVTRQRIYGDDLGTKLTCDMVHHGHEPEMVLRAASAPAITTVAGWAAELVHVIYTDLMPLLLPQAILTGLAARGLALNFGRAGRINIPTRSRTPALSGSFIGEGAAIPVRQGAFTSQTLVPKKVAVISSWTREMDEFSIPAIEGIIREAIMLDTGVAIDSVLIDANPATVIRPAGLLNGVTPTAITAGGGLTSINGDLKALTQALAAATYGNIREPVWLLNPAQVIAAELAMAPNGLFPWRDEVARGTLNNIPFIQSATVTPATVILLDAADFVTAGAEGPRLEMSDQATLHFEDTAPLDLATVGTPPVVAAPQKSLFQTDSLALRLVMRLNWLMRRANVVVMAQSVTWN